MITPVVRETSTAIICAACGQWGVIKDLHLTKGFLIEHGPLDLHNGQITPGRAFPCRVALAEPINVHYPPCTVAWDTAECEHGCNTQQLGTAA